jgi:hypothetical protein
LVGHSGDRKITPGLVPGTYTVTEPTPGAAWNATGTGNVAVNSGGQGSITVTNNYVVPHTSIVGSVTANTTTVPIGGGWVTVTVTDLNDGTVDLTGVYFNLTGSPALQPNATVLMNPSNIVMHAGDTQVFTASVFISGATTLTVVGHGMGNGVDVTGLSETGSVQVRLPPQVPASSDFGIVLLIVGLAGAVTFFGWQRRRRSQ